MLALRVQMSAMHCRLSFFYALLGHKRKITSCKSIAGQPVLSSQPVLILYLLRSDC